MKLLKRLFILALILGVAFIAFVDYDKPIDGDSVDFGEVEDFVKDVADEAEDLVDEAIDLGKEI